MIDHEELRQAWLAFRAENGHQKAVQVLLKFGADEHSPSLESVPESKWPELMTALTGKASASSLTAIGEPRKTLADLHDAAWNKWNFGWRRPQR